MDRATASAARWLPFVVLAAAWLAHGGALGGDWVRDDISVVRDNPVLEAGLAETLAAEAWPSGPEGPVWRPLTLLSFALEAPLWRRALGEDSSAGFHLTNLVLHGLASLLVLAVGLSLLPDRPLAVGAGALVFALHPLFVGAVAPATGRAELLAGVLGLATLWLWLRVLSTGAALTPLVALGLLLTVLANESGVGIVVFLAGAVLFVRPALGRWLPGLLLVAGVLVGWAWLRPPPAAPLGAALAEAFAGLARGLLGFLVPVGFVRDRWTLPPTVGPWAAAAGVLVLVASGLLGLRSSRRAAFPGAASGLALFGAAFVVGALVAPPGAPLEGRFAYPFALPLALLLGAGLGGLVRRVEARGRLRGAAATALVLAPPLVGLLFLTRAETSVWADEAALHRALVASAPGRPELELRYVRRLVERAERARRDLSQRPTVDEVSRRLRDQVASDIQEAASRARNLTAAHPKRPQAWRLLGWAELLGGKAPAAETALRRGLELDPYLQGGAAAGEVPEAHRLDLARAYGQLGQALEAQGRRELALEHWKLAARLAPRDASTLARAGRACIKAGRDQEGLVLLRRAIDTTSDEEGRRRLQEEFDTGREAARARADAAITRARLAEYEADYRGALAAYEDALVADPSRLEAYLRLAWLRGEYFGDFRMARALLERARRMMEEAGGDVDALRRIDDALTKLDEQQRAAESEEAE